MLCSLLLVAVLNSQTLVFAEDDNSTMALVSYTFLSWASMRTTLRYPCHLNYTVKAYTILSQKQPVLKKKKTTTTFNYNLLELQ